MPIHSALIPRRDLARAGACSFCATPGSKSHRSVSGQGTRSTLSGLPKWRDVVMDVLLILLIVFLFAALPTLPYSASGRTRYEHHHAAEPEHGVEPAKANSQVLRSVFRYSFLVPGR